MTNIEARDKKIKGVVKELKKTGDANGLKLDKGIFQTIVFLNALGFYTVSSCEGHLNWGLPYAWIDFSGKTAKKESGLAEKGKSIYWSVFNHARDVANELSDKKYVVKNKRKSELESKYWHKIYNKELKSNKKYKQFLSLQKKMYKDSLAVWGSVARIGKNFLDLHPEYTNDFYLEYLSESVRLNFVGRKIVMGEKFTKKQKISVKKKSDIILKLFTKYLKDLSYGKV